MPTITPITNSTANSATATNAAVPTQSQFLQLLVTQMQNQDPLAPTDDTAFVAQLAQFATLEQATNQTQVLQAMQQQLQSGAGTQALQLVGKTVTASFSTVQVPAAGQGTPNPVQFTLSGPASSVTITLKDANGNLARTLTTGALPAGAQSLAWDGNDNNGAALPQGGYNVSVSATGANGTQVSAQTQLTGMVSGVAYQNGAPLLIVPGAQVPMSNISQVSN